MNKNCSSFLKKVLITQVVVLGCSVLFCNAYAKEFSDLTSEHWAYTYIDNLTNKGVISGYDTGEYMPERKIKCMEFVKLMVATVVGQGHEQEFQEYVEKYNKDNLSENWYLPYFWFAWDNGLLEKTIDIPNCMDELTREKAVVMLKKCVDYLGYNYEKEIVDYPQNYTDLGTIESEEDINKIFKDIADSKEKIVVTVYSENPDEVDIEEIREKYGYSDDVEIKVEDKIEAPETISEEEYLELKKKLDEEEENSLKEREELLKKVEDYINGNYDENEVEEESSANNNSNSKLDKIIYEDTKDLDESTIQDINLSTSLGLIKGYDDGLFKPQNTLTRAEVATIVYRFIDIIIEKNK